MIAYWKEGQASSYSFNISQNLLKFCLSTTGIRDEKQSFRILSKSFVSHFWHSTSLDPIMWHVVSSLFSIPAISNTCYGLDYS